MPLRLRRGSVTAIVERLEGLARIEVDGAPCVAYPRLTGPVALGDEVLVNVEARELGLGSGGFDVLYANLTRGLGLEGEPGAHVMKLPYTPLQVAALHGEEEGGLAESLAAMPVVCCSLHSQLAPVCAGIGEGVRVAYLQIPGGALPVSFSDSVRALKERALIEVAVAVGACVDGDVACVSTASALAWAAGRGSPSPSARSAPASSAPGARSDTAASRRRRRRTLRPRWVGSRSSPSACRRPMRARGTRRLHHTRAVLELCLGDVEYAWPADVDAPEWLQPRADVDVAGWQEACAGLPLQHMGRGPDDDPAFFAAAYAAGKLARNRIGDGMSAPDPDA